MWLAWIPWPSLPPPRPFLHFVCPTRPGAAEILFHSQQILLLVVGPRSSSQHRRVTDVLCCFGPCRPVRWSVAPRRLRIAELGAARVIAAAERTCPHLLPATPELTCPRLSPRVGYVAAARWLPSCAQTLRICDWWGFGPTHLYFGVP